MLYPLSLSKQLTEKNNLKKQLTFSCISAARQLLGLPRLSSSFTRFMACIACSEL